MSSRINNVCGVMELDYSSGDGRLVTLVTLVVAATIW